MYYLFENTRDKKEAGVAFFINSEILIFRNRIKCFPTSTAVCNAVFSLPMLLWRHFGGNFSSLEAPNNSYLLTRIPAFRFCLKKLLFCYRVKNRVKANHKKVVEKELEISNYLGWESWTLDRLSAIKKDNLKGPTESR